MNMKKKAIRNDLVSGHREKIKLFGERIPKILI